MVTTLIVQVSSGPLPGGPLYSGLTRIVVTWTERTACISTGGLSLSSCLSCESLTCHAFAFGPLMMRQLRIDSLTGLGIGAGFNQIISVRFERLDPAVIDRPVSIAL